MNDQLIIIKVGILIGQKIPDINIDAFKNMEELKDFLNDTLTGINIMDGMYWTDVIKELERIQ